jgi:hypothetical protein
MKKQKSRSKTVLFLVPQPPENSSAEGCPEPKSPETSDTHHRPDLFPVPYEYADEGLIKAREQHPANRGKKVGAQALHATHGLVGTSQENCVPLPDNVIPFRQGRSK